MTESPWARIIYTIHKQLRSNDLFTRAQSIRWLLIDEISTLGPLVLGIFDTNLRRARARQPYAKRNDGMNRPFGGVNFRLCGDWLQLPPVRALGIYSNPFTADMEFPEQRVMEYFWRRGKNSLNGLIELSVSHRQKDDLWLKDVLQQHRDGAESWEVYCFVHGLPTLHTGTWRPSIDRPECGDPRCVRLSKTHWEELREANLSWEQRQSFECDLCKAERVRRCRVVQEGNSNELKQSEEPFAHAPYIHPFNAPKYNAQILRSATFAKASNNGSYGYAHTTGQ